MGLARAGAVGKDQGPRAGARGSPCGPVGNQSPSGRTASRAGQWARGRSRRPHPSDSARARESPFGKGPEAVFDGGLEGERSWVSAARRLARRLPFPGEAPGGDFTVGYFSSSRGRPREGGPRMPSGRLRARWVNEEWPTTGGRPLQCPEPGRFPLTSLARTAPGRWGGARGVRAFRTPWP